MWNYFNFLAYAIIGYWIIASILYIFSKSPKSIFFAQILSVLGIGIIGFYIGYLWIHLQRPPMRTLGETRLLYSFFVPLIGFIFYMRWKYTWIMLYSFFLSIVFLLLNITLPEAHDKTLMPALQSVWFAPHVIVYMFAYAILAVASLVSLRGIWEIHKQKTMKYLIHLVDNLVYFGFAFLTLGLVFGALWAKQAWGHYWTWDPKEIWALLTWFCYLIYLHIRFSQPKKIKQHFYIIAVAFIILLICWFGINYLSVATNSVHTYNN